MVGVRALLSWLRLAGDAAERGKRKDDVVLAERFDPVDLDTMRKTVATALGTGEPPAHRKPLTLARARRRARLAVLPMSLVAWAVLLAVIAANATVFWLLGGNYFAWYLDSASAIALGFSVLSLGVSLDEFPELISAEPVGFAMGVCRVGVEMNLGQVAPFSRRRTDGELRDLPEGTVACSWNRSLVADFVITFLFSRMVVLLFYAWAVVVAPLQYWVNLVTGAPAREAMASADTTWLAVTPGRGVYTVGRKTDRPEGSREVSFGAKPVTTTALLSAVVLWLVARIVEAVS